MLHPLTDRERPIHFVRSLTAVTLFLVSVPAVADPLRSRSGAAPERPNYTLPAAVSEIRVDAVMDEPAWAEALVLELAYETYPGENTPAPVRTECLLISSRTHLYVGFRAFDPEPEKILARYTDRDLPFEDDWLGIEVDTFNDERRAYEFFVNPLGVQMDLIENDVTFTEDASWDAIWESAGQLTSEGYVVEMAIPFRQLRFRRSDGPQTWGLEVIRHYPRDQEYMFRIQPRDRNIACHMCQISKITGFEGVVPGRNLLLSPTLTATRTDVREDFPDGDLVTENRELEPGITGRWGFTPNLTLMGAVNPDFSQVEADVARLDINTPFALFYPEKRPFFIEDADYFESPINAVYTRTVVDPLWGVKMTGKAGPNEFGTYLAEDEVTSLLLPGSQSSDLTLLEASNTTGIFRYRRDVGETSSLGALITGRTGADYGNLVFGVDGMLRFTGTDSFEFQVLGSETEYPATVAEAFGQPVGKLTDMAWSAHYRHNSRNWWWKVLYLDLGRDFRADSGYAPRVDYRRANVGLMRTWWGDASDWYISWAAGGELYHDEDQAGEPLEEEAVFWVNVDGPLRSFGEVYIGWEDDVYNAVRFNKCFQGFHANFWPTGSLYLGLDGTFGGQIDYANTRDGDLTRLEPEVRYRFGRHFSLSLNHTFERLDVAGNGLRGRHDPDHGRLYDANLSEIRAVYQFNVRTFVRLITQFAHIERNPDLYLDTVDARTRRLFNQFLFSYKINPQTVFFLGYSDNHLGFTDGPESDTVDLTQSDWTVFAKIGYAWSL